MRGMKQSLTCAILIQPLLRARVLLDVESIDAEPP
jgi:hypothetical protein